MSMQISQVFQDFYDSEVKRKNNDFSQLKSLVYGKGNIVGKQIYFRKAGDGVASKHNPNSNVTYMNTDFSQVAAQMDDWEAFDLADKVQQMKFNFDEASELADVAAKACGRRQDQIIIDALKKSTATSIGDATTEFNVDLLTRIQEHFDDLSVDGEERYILWTPNQKRQLLQNTQVTSSDYNEVKALVHGEVKYFMGFNFVHIATRKEGGLPVTSAQHTGYAFQKRHVGYGENTDIKTSMDWIAEKRGYMVGAEFSAGATIIDEDGVVPFVTKKL